MPRLSDKERLILELLVEHGDLYGFQLVAASRRRLKRGSVYVTLNRMVEKGFVESEPGPRAPSDTGLPRPLYRPTALGRRGRRAWTTLARARACDEDSACRRQYPGCAPSLRDVGTPRWSSQSSHRRSPICSSKS